MVKESIMPLFGGLGWISFMLLIGVVLRAKVGLFQKYLFPASIIGGVIGFIAVSSGLCAISSKTFTLFAVHFFTINFISIGLTGFDKNQSSGNGVGKSVARGMLWMVCMFFSAFGLQALIGVGVISLTNTFSTPIWEGLGFMVPFGFAQGPGQAVAVGNLWQGPFKIPDAVSIGLTFAAVGFLLASFVGVPLANWGIRKGYTANTPKELPRDFITGLSEKGQGPSAGRQTTHSANIDGLAFHLAVLFTCFMLTYLVSLGLEMIFPKAIKGLAFGFIFAWGVVVGFVVRTILNKLGLGDYLDNNIQRRITGTAIDFMVVATLMAVQVMAVWNNIVPIALMVIVVGILTTLYVIYFGRRVKELGFERMMAIYGALTGTTSSGLLLARIVDPEFKTTVSQEIGLYNAVLILGLPLMLILFPLPKVGLATGLVVAVGMFIVPLIILKATKLWGEKVW